MSIELEPRVQRLENNHDLLALELKQINKTLSKIEEAIVKQNEIISDIRLIRLEIESNKDRIKLLEDDKSKVGWAIVFAFGALVLSAIGLKGSN